MLASHPDSAVPAVKAAARGYRTNEAGARDLILTIWNVLDQNLEHTASIVNAFVDLLDEEEKKQDLLASWRGFNIEVFRPAECLQFLTIYSNVDNSQIFHLFPSVQNTQESHLVVFSMRSMRLLLGLHRTHLLRSWIVLRVLPLHQRPLHLRHPSQDHREPA